METAGLVLGYIAVIGGLLFGAIPIAFHYTREKQRREMEHLERMRALELGRTLPQDEPWWSPPRIAVLIGGAVPLGVFLSVGAATSFVGFHEGMWVAAAMVGMASVISGSILAGLSYNQRRTSDRPEVTKPYVEDDAYDVVSSRG
jgi:hypothetical protein